MTLTYLHLMLNHLPIFGSVVMFFLMAYAVIFKKERLIKTYLWYFVAIGVLTIPVFLTGDPASEYIRTFLPGVNNDLIESHETFGYISFFINLALAVSGLAALRFFRSKEILPVWFKYLFLIVAFLSVLAISWTAKTGGEIRHTEITVEHAVTK